MTLWLLLSLFLVPAMLLLAWPFLRRYRHAAVANPQDLALFREQVREVEQELARGVLSAAEADETRRDIERRALAAVRTSGGGDMGESTDKVRVIGLAVTLGWVTLGSVALYLGIGQPELAGPSTSDRLMARSEPVTPPLFRATIDPAPPQPARAQQTAEPLADVNTMIAQLAARLEANPKDLTGWKMLGWSHLSRQNFDAAVEAYGRAADLAPRDAEVLSLHGEAVVRAAGGRVTPRAQEIFTRALAVDPANPRAGFFAGMALEQAGQPAAALERWLDLHKTAPPGADFLPGLVARIREVAERTGYDLGDWLGPSVSAAPPPGNPTPEDIAAARQLAPADRQQMIRGMVDGLAARLEDAPDDPDGWARLIRSYTVLDDETAALQALSTARKVFATDNTSLARIDRLATELGLR